MTLPPECLSTALSATESAAAPTVGGFLHEGVRWALYARSGAGDPEQLRKQFGFMSATVEDLGGRVAATFEDLGAAREGLRELIRAGHRGEFDRVMVLNVDQFGRQLPALMRVLTDLRDLGVGITLASGEDINGAFIASTVTSAASAAGYRAARTRAAGGRR